MPLFQTRFAGICLDSSKDGTNDKVLGVAEGMAFTSLTLKALEKIASKPIGADLLALIGKRAAGIGTSLKAGRVKLMYGTGTLTPGRVSAEKTIMGSMYMSADKPDGQSQTSTALKIKTDNGVVSIPSITRAGAGSSCTVVYNPFVSIGDTYIHQLRQNLKTFMQVETPAFVALAHELCHAVHAMSGTLKAHPFPEEAWTVGAGKYLDTRISENAIRREHNIPLRSFYGSPGDCD